MATMRINGTDFHMSDRSYALTLEGARLAETLEPAPRDIPPGKILLSHAPARDELARVEVFEERTGEYGKVYRVVRSSPGFEPAGSMARWTNGYYALWIVQRDGTRGGQQFKTLAEAFERLELWCPKVAV